MLIHFTFGKRRHSSSISSTATIKSVSSSISSSVKSSSSTTTSLTSLVGNTPLSWNYQIGQNAVDFSVDVDMYDIDMFGTSQSDINQLLSLGKMVVCYIDFGTYEPGRPDASSFPAAALGKAVIGWPGEKWLDITNPMILTIMENRVILAQSKKCQGIEPDNIDGYENNPGFPITFQDQMTYNTWIANTVHAYGMTVALKNDLDQVADLIDLFDYAIVEQCVMYKECNLSSPFIEAGKQVFEVEYKGSNGVTTANLGFCAQTNSLEFSSILKTLQLNALPICSCLTELCTA